jgi:hypothetical protein
LQAAKILQCSYIEVRNDPERHTIMSEAFTLYTAEKEAGEIQAEAAKRKAELDGKT